MKGQALVQDPETRQFGAGMCLSTCSPLFHKRFR